MPVSPYGTAEGYKVGPHIPATTRFAHDFSRILIHSESPPSLQAKLAVNAPGSAYEQEADRIAERVTSLPEQRLQRSCTCSGRGSKCENEPATPEGIQTKQVQANDAEEIASPIVNEALRSQGQPLDQTTREFMELRFGHDFNRVRVHTNAADYSVLRVRLVLMRLSRLPPALHQKSGQHADPSVNKTFLASF